MGQKTSPTGFRLVFNRRWKSVWFANKQETPALIGEDKKIRDFLMKKACCAGTSSITIKRMSGKIEVTIFTARPGLVIGKKGAEIEVLKGELKVLTQGKDVFIEVEEIKRPDMDAKLVADSIAKQLERRVPFRRVLKKTMQTAMDAGAAGIRVQISGRVGGAEIARTEWYKEGRIPLQTIRADIDYSMGRAETTYGSIGVKVWINRGEEAASNKAAGV
jgi:small subunit ribosomal protein S3